ncbi:hypothetical protein GOARA_036_01840 [Gordonia araii NBRC 100433]|uniref:Uncharacterized protein n=1 Tax=Gordonia araii NBRC 100433 TaxID=1073574 RepID=G7H0S6_9ACTN|nr:hypothetical protein GOARA_036_01840 [Gordonia araii NBRC 100433]
MVCDRYMVTNHHTSAIGRNEHKGRAPRPAQLLQHGCHLVRRAARPEVHLPPTQPQRAAVSEDGSVEIPLQIPVPCSCIVVAVSAVEFDDEPPPVVFDVAEAVAADGRRCLSTWSRQTVSPFDASQVRVLQH